MPVEANPIGIRPIDRPRTTGPEGVTRRDDGGSSSAFSPKTNVAIKTAIQDMAGILSKVSASQDAGVEKMPQDLQKIVQNIMRQAFSIDETLAQGIGSTLESQRFSMEQLTAFSRMLTQLGSLAEKGFSTEISDNLQALLTNLKAYVTEQEGAQLSPVLLNKAAFEILDMKVSIDDLGQALQMLLSEMQLAGMNQQAPQMNESDTLGFLKQLVQYFMPRPQAEESAPQQQPQQAQQQSGEQPQAQQNAPQQNAQNANGQPQTQNSNQPQQSQQPQAQQNASQQNSPNANGQPQTQNANQPQQSQAQQNAPQQNSPNANGQPQTQNANQPQQAQAQQNAPQQNSPNANGQPQTQNANQPQQSQQPQAQQNAPQQNASNANGQPQTQNANQPQQSQQPQTQQNAPQQNAPNANGQPQTQNANQPQQSQQPQTQQNAPQQNAPNANGQPQTQNANQSQQSQQPQTQMKNERQFPPGTNEVRQAKAQLMSQPIQNTPQAMETMKSLAQLLLKNAAMTEQDTQLLQNFVNGKETILSEKEARQLQTLLRICQQNVPTTVQQAAIQQNMPDLPKLWAFMQLCDMVVTKRMTARQLKKAGRDVADFALSMRHSMGGENSSVQRGRSLHFMLPLFMGENEKAYPSYIHVYDEDGEDRETGEPRKETWLRICVLTDNIGAVDITSRVYDGLELDMRIFFSDRETANEFREYVPELKESMKETELHLNDFKIGVAGEKRAEAEG